jgi:2-C-methyl-D-erythritol 4-phosphate cytidylyltransferase/2-C-methyl-D-erythritol 2,4-cyclodiphosphate synthase
LPFHQKLAGHSDADVALHAITDAILGALAMGDIGDHFPPSDPQWRGAASDQFLRHACSLAKQAGYQIGNIDVTIICEAPKIGPHRQAMRTKIAEIMATEIDSVSVKATTTEMLGFTGRGEGIAAQASAVLLAKV